jgi:hypothetical protein
MGPMFSLLIVAVGCALYAAVAYMALKISKKHKASLINVLGVVGGGIFGGCVGVLFNVFILQVRTIESTSNVVAFLASLIVSSLLFSFFSLHIVEKISSRSVHD